MDEIADPGARGFSVWTGTLMFRGVVVRQGEAVTGWIDRCPHVGVPLTLGDDRYLTRDGAHLLCVNHGALFRIADGVCTAGPCVGQALKPWPVTLVDGEVRVA